MDRWMDKFRFLVYINGWSWTILSSAIRSFNLNVEIYIYNIEYRYDGQGLTLHSNKTNPNFSSLNNFSLRLIFHLVIFDHNSLSSV